MQYTVALPHPTPGSQFADPDVLTEIAGVIEACGFDACAVMDHPFPLLEDPRAGGHALDIFTLGGFLAAATTRLAVHLNLVVVGYRNPFLVARSVSSLDHLTKGRLIVGLGAGYMKAEFDALGADHARRGELVDEGVVAMKAAWSGEPVALESPLWSAQGNTMFPGSYSTPHPKLFRGGNARRAIESAVRHFDGWNPFEAPRDLARKAGTAAIDSIDELRRRIGWLRETEERLERANRVEICFDRPDPSWLEETQQSVDEAIAELEELGVTRLAVYLAGTTPEEVIESVRRLAEQVLERPRLPARS